MVKTACCAHSLVHKAPRLLSRTTSSSRTRYRSASRSSARLVSRCPSGVSVSSSTRALWPSVRMATASSVTQPITQSAYTAENTRVSPGSARRDPVTTSLTIRSMSLRDITTKSPCPIPTITASRSRSLRHLCIHSIILFDQAA